MKIVIFKSTRDMIQVERALKKCKYNFKVIPVPRSLSSECGMAIEIGADLIEAVEKVADEKRVVVTIFDKDSLEY